MKNTKENKDAFKAKVMQVYQVKMRVEFLDGSERDFYFGWTKNKAGKVVSTDTRHGEQQAKAYFNNTLLSKNKIAAARIYSRHEPQPGKHIVQYKNGVWTD